MTIMGCIIVGGLGTITGFTISSIYHEYNDNKNKK